MSPRSLLDPDKRHGPVIDPAVCWEELPKRLEIEPNLIGKEIKIREFRDEMGGAALPVIIEEWL